MRHPESMLLIIITRPRSFELYIFLQQPMCADDDIDDPSRRILENLFDLLTCQKTADHFDAHGMIAKAMAKSL